jgi:hypothetical protein
MNRRRAFWRTITVTPLGFALLLMVAVGAVLVFLGSGTAAKVGFGIAVAGVLGIAGDNLPAGVLGGFRSPRRRLTEGAAPEPEYIESTAPVSEDVWRREQQRYRRRDQNR